jgi:hypothetical protein
MQLGAVAGRGAPYVSRAAALDRRHLWADPGEERIHGALVALELEACELNTALLQLRDDLCEPARAGG